jgi:type II secretory ATPase GspE/PulE/Tfp pilus assembly ATPase PilB-like protein
MTAVKAGTNLMLTQALKKAASGVTSFEEVYRVVADA